MYTWLFSKIYYFYKSKKNHDPIFNTSLLVFFTQGVHFLLCLKILSLLLDFKIFRFSSDSSTNKLIFLPLGFLWLIFVHIYFKKKVHVLDKTKGSNPLTIYQLLGLIFIVLGLPLYITIKLSGG